MKRVFVLRDEAIKQRAIEAILAAPTTGKLTEVRIVPHTKPRTLDQNALYWASMTEIADQFKARAQDLHEALKERHCPPKRVDLPDGTCVWVKSTTLLDTTEMAEYMEQCFAWASQLGVEFSR